MTNYIIQDNINFYDELYKSLDGSDDDEDTLCLITGVTLEDNHVNLECGHKFNYKPLFREIYIHKCVQNDYNVYNLTKSEKIKYNQSKVDYFIKCPYCRKIQFTLLPYYEMDGISKVYGINTSEPKYNNNKYKCNYTKYDYDYVFKGITYKYLDDKCCTVDDCSNKMLAEFHNTQLYYCYFHWNNALKAQKKKEKEEEKAQKQLDKEIEKKQKQLDKEKAFEEKNQERIAKGLKPLKPRQSKKPTNNQTINNQTINENIIVGESVIGEYIPDTTIISVVCKGIIKTGANKGKQCGKKCWEKDVDYCCKHSSKYKEEVANLKDIIDKDLINNLKK